MKRFLYLLLFIILTGCTTVNVPPYIQDKHPYSQTLLSDYDKVLTTTKKVLKEQGWRITRELDPAIFEKAREFDNPETKQTLIFAQTFQKSWVGRGKFAQMNIYLLRIDEVKTEIEVRYQVVSNAFVKSFYRYRNDKLIESMIEKINQELRK